MDPGNPLTALIHGLRPWRRANASDRQMRKQKTSDRVNWLLQGTAIFLTVALSVQAIGIAIIFGIFSILAWIDGRTGLTQARIANQLSLASYCSARNVVQQIDSTCSLVLANLDTAMIALDLGLLSDQRVSHSLSRNAKIGIGIGAGVGGLLLILLLTGGILVIGKNACHLVAGQVIFRLSTSQNETAGAEIRDDVKDGANVLHASIKPMTSRRDPSTPPTDLESANN